MATATIMRAIATMMLRWPTSPPAIVRAIMYPAMRRRPMPAGQTVTFYGSEIPRLDGVLPGGRRLATFEVTPGYVDKEELEGEGPGRVAGPTCPPQHQPRRPLEENPTDETALCRSFRVWWLLAALGCLLLVLAALLAARWVQPAPPFGGDCRGGG